MTERRFDHETREFILASAREVGRESAKAALPKPEGME